MSTSTAENLGSHPFETLWTWKEVCAYLQVSRSWVYQKSEEGLLPSLRVGGLLRFSPERIRAYALGDEAVRR